MDKRILAGLLVVIIVVGIVYIVYVGRQPEGVEEEGTELSVITRHSVTIWLATKEAFLDTDMAREHNITDIRFISPNPVLWIDTVKRVGDLDVGWGGGPSLFDDLDGEGLVAPMTDAGLLSTIGEIDDDIRGEPLKRLDEQGRPVWVAAAISSFGFIINYNVLNEYNLTEPSLWEDLGSTALAKILPKPAVAFARALQSTSHTRIYEIILQKFGWDDGWALLGRLTANGRPYSGSVEALTGVQTGECPIGIGIDFYGFSTEIQFPGTKYVLPFNESIVNGDPICLLSTSQHPEAAQAFIEFVLSVEGQKIWLVPEISRMPVREDVFRTEEGQTRLDLYSNYNTTISNIGIPFEEWRSTAVLFSLKYYFDAIFADSHAELVRVWDELVSAYEDGLITEERFKELAYEIGKPLTWTQDGESYEFTFDYASSINVQMKQAAFGSEMARIWRDAAVQRYEALMDEIPGS